MDLLCPECLGRLAITDGDHARCTVHGGNYRVLFRRPPGPVAGTISPIPVGAATTATAHPGFAVPPPLPLSPPVPIAAPRFSGMRCVQHSSTAIAQCNACGAFMCSACDVSFEGGVHTCPRCAAPPPPPERARSRAGAGVICSLFLAAWCSLGLIVVFVATVMSTLKKEPPPSWLALFCGAGIILPAIAGFILALSGIKRRHETPGLFWGATVWNGAILLGLLLLIVIGRAAR